jgi:hypothetical protein
MICCYHVPFGNKGIKDVLIYPKFILPNYRDIHIISVMWKQCDIDGYCICFLETFFMDCILYTSSRTMCWICYNFSCDDTYHAGKIELVIPLLGWNKKSWTILLVMFFPLDGYLMSIIGNEILNPSYLKIWYELDKFFKLFSKEQVWSITEIVWTLKAWYGSMVHSYDDLKIEHISLHTTEFTEYAYNDDCLPWYLEWYPYWIWRIYNSDISDHSWLSVMNCHFQIVMVAVRKFCTLLTCG